VRDEADELAPGWGKQIWQQAVNRHLQARQQQQQAVQAEEDKKTQANRYNSSSCYLLSSDVLSLHCMLAI
jgi:hypothetical protein